MYEAMVVEFCDVFSDGVAYGLLCGFGEGVEDVFYAIAIDVFHDEYALFFVYVIYVGY